MKEIKLFYKILFQKFITAVTRSLFPVSQLHKFNNKKWESSFYKLGKDVGEGNFGLVRKAIVQVNDRIPPDLRGREVSLKDI